MARKAFVLLGLAAVLAGGCSPAVRAEDHYANAILLMEDFRVAAALAELDRAIAMDDELVLAYSAKGDILRLEGRYDEAAGVYEKAVELDPMSFRDHFSLGLVYQTLERLNKAAAAYYKACMLQPKHYESNFNLSTCYLQLNQLDDAEKFCLRAMDLERPGTETVLVVEDESAVRDQAVLVLASYGYTVLDAADGQAAIEISRSHPGPIDLLLTDVIMPGLNGRELADLLKPERSEMHVLYMSGYTGDAIESHGVLARGVAFLPKPFTLEDLLRKVRKVLDQGKNSQIDHNKKENLDDYTRKVHRHPESPGTDPGTQP